MLNNIPFELRQLNSTDLNCSGIYIILNTINGKVYVGSTANFRTRFAKHLNELLFNRHHSRYFQFAWNKYGEESFQFVIIENVKNLNLLVSIEQLWINGYQACDSRFGYNLAPIAGSIRGIKRTEETKNKMSLAWLNRPPASLKTRAKMSRSAKGKVISEQTKLSMSVAQTGREHSKETKIKISLANKGKPKSEAHKIKNGLAKQNFDKWPHACGRKCKCIECRQKDALEKRNNYLARKAKANA